MKNNLKLYSVIAVIVLCASYLGAVMQQAYSVPTTRATPFYIQYGRVDGAFNNIPNAIVDLTTSRTLTTTPNECGSVVKLDRAAGTAVTLPVPVVGCYIDFIVSSSVTSNTFKVITDSASTFLIGNYMDIRVNTTNLPFSFDGTTHVACTMNGTTTGGVKGTILRFTAISTTLWHVNGTMNGSSTAATCAATS